MHAVRDISERTDTRISHMRAAKADCVFCLKMLVMPSVCPPRCRDIATDLARASRRDVDVINMGRYLTEL
eukprot:6203303-Pleurochrysis_carterae.AAC.2